MKRMLRFRFRFLAVSRRLAATLACVAALTSAHAEQAAGPKIDESYLALLAQPDLSSPRATLMSLQQSVQQAYQVLSSAYDKHRHNPGFTASAEVKRQVTTAQLLLRRAIATLDLSEVPEVDREEVGTQTVLLLKEILDRLPTTPAERIPGPEEVASGHAKAPIQAWSLPYAEIQIVRVKDGPEAGNYLFSSATVARVPEFFNLIKGFSERPDAEPDFFAFLHADPRASAAAQMVFVDQRPAHVDAGTSSPVRRCGSGSACSSSRPRSAASVGRSGVFRTNASPHRFL